MNVLSDVQHGKSFFLHAAAPGVFRTDLNAAFLDGTDHGRELRMRTPMGPFGQAGIAVDGGFLSIGREFDLRSGVLALKFPGWT